MDVAVFREATVDLLEGIPLWIYWHDSALGRRRLSDPSRAALEASSARAADRLLFNAEGHRQRFLTALQAIDPAAAAMGIARSATLPPGFSFPPSPPQRTAPEATGWFLWIFRGDPEAIDRLVDAMGPAAAKGIDFRLIALSEDPPQAARALERLPRALRARLLGILRPEDPEVEPLGRSKPRPPGNGPGDPLPHPDHDLRRSGDPPMGLGRFRAGRAVA
jgi:hypothetical protein